MQLKYPKTLITGRPGIGKTTLIKNIVVRMSPIRAVGFYTAEILSRGHRQGFELQALSGERGILSHINSPSRLRVGRYGVDVRGFDRFLDQLDILNPEVDLVVIDEIGKMEALSKRFRNLVCEIVKADIPLIGTVALKGTGFISEVKQIPNIRFFELTLANRNRLIADICVE